MVSADISYIIPKAEYLHEKPFQLFVEGLEADQKRTNVDFETAVSTVENIRGQDFTPSLDENGFKMVLLEEARDWSTPEDFDARYVPAVKRMLEREMPDADEILISSWRHRKSDERSSDDQDHTDPNDNREYLLPAPNAHIDVSPMNGIRRIQGQCEEHGIDRVIQRARIINVWRPVSHAVYDWPLALCDGTTVTDDDCITVDQIYPKSESNPMFLKKSENYRWCYYKNQQPHEAWVFKQFDSAPSVRTRSCPHVSFLEPHVPAGSPGRMSVEVRATVLNYAPAE